VLLSEVNILGKKQLYYILPTSAAEAVPTQACNLLDITILPSAIRGCAKLKPTAYVIYLSALHSQEQSLPTVQLCPGPKYPGLKRTLKHCRALEYKPWWYKEIRMK
jgi:hypothetical protein